MKSKSKLLLSTITAAAIFAGGVAFPYSSNVKAALKPVTNLELRDGEVTGTTVDVRGWALNESGVAAVDLYVDGKYVTTEDSYNSRPDVQKYFPQYKDAANSGYDFTLTLAPGKHKIRVYDIGRNGVAIYKEATINVKGRAPRTGLELSNGQKISGRIDIRGWALNTTGIKAVDVYIDGRYTATLEPSEERPDVVKAFPEYADQLKCGFDYKVPYLGSGYHKIKVYGIGNDGTATCQEANIFGQGSLDTKIGLELNDNEPIGELVDIRGWALDSDEIKAVDIYVDGKYTKTISQSEFETRPDVIKTFPQYEDYGNKDKCGFDYKLQLSEGRHNIKVYAISVSNDIVIGSKEANIIAMP